MGGSDNTRDGLAGQPSSYRVLRGHPCSTGIRWGGASRSPDGLFAQHEGERTRGRPAVRRKGTTREPQTAPRTTNNSPPRGAQVPPPHPPPSVPLHCHCTRQDASTPPRPGDPTGGSPTPRGFGTQWANPGTPAAQRRVLPVPRGSSTQWATTGAPEAHCGKVQEREGTSDKTGVGRTKDNGTAAMQRKSPGTSRRRTRHQRQPLRSARHARSARYTRPSKERVMRARDPRSSGAQGVDGRYNVWRSGAPGPHAVPIGLSPPNALPCLSSPPRTPSLSLGRVCQRSPRTAPR